MQKLIKVPTTSFQSNYMMDSSAASSAWQQSREVMDGSNCWTEKQASQQNARSASSILLTPTELRSAATYLLMIVIVCLLNLQRD